VRFPQGKITPSIEPRHGEFVTLYIFEKVLVLVKFVAPPIQRQIIQKVCVHFHGSNFKFFSGLCQKNLNISTSARWILTQRPDLEWLLNSINYRIT
jgi:hypothetical protein